MEGLKGRTNKGQRVFVLNGDLIEVTIINKGVMDLAFLGDKGKPCTNRRRGLPDDTTI